jgi:hypothetical protein
VAYMQVKNDDLVVATHGRGFWIMDNLTALREITPEVVSAPVHLFGVAPATRRPGGRGFGRGSRPGVQFSDAGGMVVAFEDRKGPDGRTRRSYLNAGQNAPTGVLIEYSLKQPPSGELALTIVDAKGQVIQRFSSQAKDGRAMPAGAGMNRFIWDMRYPRGREAAPDGALPFEGAGAPGAAPADLAPVKARLRAIEGQLVRLEGTHTLDMAPKGLSNKLAALFSDVAGADAKPTKQAYAVFEDLSARFAAQLRQLDEVIAKDVPAATETSTALPKRE